MFGYGVVSSIRMTDHQQINDFFDESMSTVDVKSLFKSGKKTIKAFKISAGPVATEEKSQDETMENWETHQAPSVVPTVTVALEEFKPEAQEETTKPGVSWTQAYVYLSQIVYVRSSEETVEPVPQQAPTRTSAYVPPSQRRAEAALAMPSLSDLSRAASSNQGVVRATSAASSSVAPPRLKLITSAAKKAMEDEAKKKEEEKQKKEAEKQARKEQLRAELAQQTANTKETTSRVAVDDSLPETKAAPLDQIYAKYIDRPKVGRKLSSTAA